MPAAFKIINDAIKRKVAVLTVKYDGRLGYPKSISNDYIAMAVDDEISYRITNFKTLK